VNDAEFEEDGVEDLNEDQRDALDQLHGWMSHRIAEAHLLGDREDAESLAGLRRTISDSLSAEPRAASRPAAEEADADDGRDALEERREDLTRALHEAVANKDSQKAARLDRERGELTGELYGNGAVVGTSGRSL
jgi:hypothetical protein